MKVRKLAFAVSLLASAVGLSGAALANAEIEKRSQDHNWWSVPGQNNKLHRHSQLKDINTGNVAKLQYAWSQSTGALRGHEGQPVVVEHGGKPMMYFSSGCPEMSKCNIVQALDLTDPDNPVQIWNYVKKTDRDESAVPRACCDTVHRGVNYVAGKIVYHTLDGFVIALDATSGKEVWVVKHAYPEKGETITGPVLVAENLVIAGFGGDEFAARGRLTAYDLETGKEVWKCHSTGSDKDVCLTPETNKANPHFGTAGTDIGIKSYPSREGEKEFPEGEWAIGGGAYWAWGSYDAEAKVIYWSTGNPGHWSPSYRCGYKGADLTHEKCNDGTWDNKWSMTTFARKVDTGEVIWAYQMTPFDQWDYDGVNENMLVDNLDVDGKKYKALVHFDRNGFAYVHDRTNGSLLRAHKFVTVDWAEKVDLKTGRPIKVKEHSPFAVGVNTPACPSAMGGKDQQPCSVDPKVPNKFYCPTNNWCMEDEPQERSHTQQGTVYVFANVYMYQVRRRDRQGRLGNSGSVSELVGHHGHRRRPDVLWFEERSLPRCRPRNGQGAVEQEARLGHHRQPDHLQGEGQAVRVDLRRSRRLDRHPCHRRSRHGRQVRRHWCHGHGQGYGSGQDPAGRRALHVPCR